MKTKLTQLEKSWILYDIGNSAFILLVSTIIPIFFESLCAADGLSNAQYLSTWSYMGSISTLIVAFIGPICGAMADCKKCKTHFRAVYAAWRPGLRRFGHGLELAELRGDLYHCQGGI